MGLLSFTRAIAAFLKAALIIAPVGETVRLQMSPRQRISESWNASVRVAEVLPISSSSGIWVKGKSPGIDPVVVTGHNGKSQLFLVVVPKPKK